MAKRYRLIFVIMVLAICLSLVLALASCDNGDGAITTDKENNNVNEETDKGTDDEVLTWNDWKVDLVPTETSAGSIIRTNNINNLVERVEIPKIDTTSYSAETITAATCTATGKVKYTLANSDKAVSFEVVTPMIPHTYGEWIIDGVNRHYRVCGECGAREYEDTDIAWSAWQVEVVPTETSAGSIIRTNNTNNLVERVEIPKIDTTSYSAETITAATCTATGKVKYTLANSDKAVSFEVVTPMIPHTYGEWIIDGVNRHYRVCEECGAREYEDTDIAWSAWQVEVVPTETSVGSIIRTNNINNLVERVEIPKIDATSYSTETITAATCTATGKVKYTLANSDKAVSFEVITPKTAHQYGEWTMCNANKRCRTCAQCGDTQYEDNMDSLYIGKDLTNVDIIDYIIMLTENAKSMKYDMTQYSGETVDFTTNMRTNRDVTLLSSDGQNLYYRLYNGRQYEYARYNTSGENYVCSLVPDGVEDAMQNVLGYLNKFRTASNLAYDAENDKFTASDDLYTFDMTLTSDGYIANIERGGIRRNVRVYDFDVPVEITLPTNVEYKTEWLVVTEPTYKTTGLAIKQDGTTFGVIVEYELPKFDEMTYTRSNIIKDAEGNTIAYEYRIKHSDGQYIAVNIGTENMTIDRVFDAYNRIARAKSFTALYEDENCAKAHFIGDKMMYYEGMTRIYNAVGDNTVCAEKYNDANAKDYYSATKQAGNLVAQYRTQILELFTDVLESETLAYNDDKQGFFATIKHNGVDVSCKVMLHGEQIAIDIIKLDSRIRLNITDITSEVTKPNIPQDAENAVYNVQMTDDTSLVTIERINLYTGDVTSVTGQPISGGNYNETVLVEGTCTIDREVYYEQKSDTSIRFVYVYKAHHSYGEWMLNPENLHQEIRTCSICQNVDYKDIEYTREYAQNLLNNWFKLKSFRDRTEDNSRVFEYDGRVIKETNKGQINYYVFDENNVAYRYWDIGDGEYRMMHNSVITNLPMQHAKLNYMLTRNDTTFNNFAISGKVDDHGKTGLLYLNTLDYKFYVHESEGSSNREVYIVDNINCLPAIETPQCIKYCAKEVTATATSPGVVKMYNIDSNTTDVIDIPALTEADYIITPATNGNKYRLRTDNAIVFVK